MSINQDVVGIVVLIIVIVVGVLTDRDSPDRGSIDVWGQDHSLDDE